MREKVFLKSWVWFGLLAAIGLFFSLVISINTPVYAQSSSPVSPTIEPAGEQPEQIEVINPHYSIEHKILEDGTKLLGHIINGAPIPSSDLSAHPSSALNPSATSVLLSGFPSYNWVFGCSAVSGAMIAGYYDRGAYPNLYTGPTNGGVMPISDTSWPLWYDGYQQYPNNPLVASHIGVDGLLTRGSIDDYWVRYDSTSQDPFITGGWTQHTWGTAIGDYMKTSQSTYQNVDGSTTFYTYYSSEKLFCNEMLSHGVSDEDGTYGRKLFYEARGYTVSDCYNQNTDNRYVGGFSLANFKAEIDAGHPVLLNLSGHSIVGFGYDGTTIYIRDTWDNNPNNIYSMTWGGSYDGMQLVSVSIVHLNPVQPPAIYKEYLPFVVKDNQVNMSPTDILLSNSSIQENLPINTLVGLLSTTDPNPGDSFTYSLVSGVGDTDNAFFNINANQLLSSVVFDYETKNSYSIRIRSTDQGGLLFEKQFLVTITKAPENVILNGDFESGSTSWTEYSTHGWDIIMLSSEVEGLYAHSGSWVAYLAGGDSETSYISQPVTIPSTMSYLHYWYWIDSDDACNYDFFIVQVGSATVRTQTLCYDKNTYGWVHSSINLSSYAGIPLTLKFLAITDDSLPSLIFLDDIYLSNTASVSANQNVPGSRELDYPWKDD